MGEEDQDDNLIISGDASHNTKVKSEKDIISPHSIDGFWVQCQISKVYPNPVTAADKAASVLSIFGSECSACDCENPLMKLFDYQSFHFTAKFLKNHDVIVWCIKLIHSDADKHVNIEVAMCEKGLGWILYELAGDHQAKSSTNVNAMDIDKPTVIPKNCHSRAGLHTPAQAQCQSREHGLFSGRTLNIEQEVQGNSCSCTKAKNGYQ